MSNRISSNVNGAGGKSATAAKSSSGDGNDDFPAALPYAHWRTMGKRKFSLDMVQFQEFLSAGTIYTRKISLQPLWSEDEDYRYRNIGFVEVCNDDVSLKFHPSGAPARTVYIRHHEELNSQWEHVANALSACTRTYFRTVVIGKIELPTTIMNMLGAALSTKRIDCLTLSYNNLDYSSLTCSYLENNPNLKDLTVEGNPLKDASVALRFAKAIGNNEHLKTLEMKECGLGGERPTKRTLKSVVKHYCGMGGDTSSQAGENNLLQTILPYLGLLNSVNIAYNDITSSDVPYLASFVASNPKAKSLHLGHSELDDNDAAELANALKRNSTIERLHMNGTEMTEKGKVMINTVAARRWMLQRGNIVKTVKTITRGITAPDAPNLIKYDHWRSLGCDMESSNALVKFQNNLYGIANGPSEESNFLFSKDKGSSFDIEIDAYRAYSQHMFIAHYSDLLAKWKCALKGLQDNSSRKVNKMRIKRVQLLSDVVDLLGNTLSAKNVVHLVLSKNRLDCQGNLSLSKFLEKKSPLKILELEENPIDDVACAQRLSEAIIAHPSLDKLVIENCGLGSNILMLSAMANTMSRVAVLHLSWNDIGNDGAAVIGNVLSTNPALLKTLSLNSNEIDDDGVAPLAEALLTNTNLRELNLGKNDITKVGESVLRKASFDDTSLITVFNSNHSCRIHVTCGNLCPETGNSRKIAIKKKMSLAMFGSAKVENTRTIPMNMHLFSDAPVELMPVELSFINRCSKFDKKNPCLSNMYEVVRNWNVTVMFSYAAGAVAPKEKKRRRKKGENAAAKKARLYAF